ncbi:MAG TPA: cation-translocating P-type ATPase [Actinomycetales bacterium]|nr:cation-translocating P-type ATPase [Actinomycetales bacterium]
MDREAGPVLRDDLHQDAAPTAPWALDARDVVRELGTDADRGLSTRVAADRLSRRGRNVLESAPPVPTWRKLLAQFQDPLIYLLLGAVAISVAAWAAEGATGWPVDAIVIAVIVVLNAVLGYVQEARAEKAVEALQEMSAAGATVVRDGVQLRVPAEEVVVGDLLVLTEGDAVPADARLVTATSLKVTEASLTGESEAVLKDVATTPADAALGDRFDMVFSGTAVTQGTGRAVVTSTGMATEMGHVADLLHRTEEEPTPLQREIGRVGRMLGIAVIVIAVVVVGTVLLTNPISSVEQLVTVLLLGVSLAVAAVPEGLPAILSVVLAIGVRRLAAHNAIVKKLNSVETLGSASVICSDKTGTLTRSEMTIARVVTASGECLVTGAGYTPEGGFEYDGAPLDAGPVRHEVERVLLGGSLANDAVLQQDESGGWSIQGDPTEAAFLVAERKLGLTEHRRERFSRVGAVPFTSERKLMSTFEMDAARGRRISVAAKGAPDVLLGRCTGVQVGEEVRELDDNTRARVLTDVDRLSANAFRTLGVAYRRLDATEVADADESLEQELVYAGTVGIIDPARPEAEVAVHESLRAGVRVMMITGDHPGTAARIATDLGIIEPGAPVVTGPELDQMDDDTLARTVRRTSVYARVAPQHKLAIVDALQADGNVVAMTGDGVNDAPALKSADIGIAMGITGTEVTKQAAKMVLADDNFATIVQAVRLGRGIFDNIRKFLRYLLSSNMGEVLTVFLGVVLAGVIGLRGDGDELVLPLLATQILWINLLTDAAPALAMGVDPEVDDVMARPPRRLTDRVIDGRMWTDVLVIGLTMAVVTLVTIDMYLPGGLVPGDGTLGNARTAGFTVLVLAQLFNAFNARSATSSAFHRLFVNPWLWGAVALSLVLQIAVVHMPFLNTAFGTVSLRPDQWLLCIAMASAVLWVSEVHKAVLRARGRGREVVPARASSRH